MFRNALFLSMTVLFFQGEPVLAQDSDPDLSEERLREIEEQLQENTRTADEIEAERQRRETELLGLRARLIETADSLREAESEATRIDREIADLTERETLARGKLAVHQRSLSQTLAALQSLEMKRPPALAVSPEDAAEAARAAMALSTAAPELADRAALLRSEIEAITDLQTQLSQQRQRRIDAEQVLAARRNVLQELLTQKERENEEATRRAEALRAENKRLAEEATSIQQLMNEIENAGRVPIPTPAPSPLATPDTNSGSTALSRRPELSVYANLPSRFADARGKIALPASGSITENFGSINSDGSKLEGVRIQTRPGGVVTAPFSGRIAFARPVARLGNVSILDVGGGYHLVFVGLERIIATEGGDISAGEVIGYMPTSLNNPVLDFQIRRNKEPLNPRGWLLSSN